MRELNFVLKKFLCFSQVSPNVLQLDDRLRF